MKRKRANIQTSGNAPSGNALPDPTAFAALRRESEGRESEGREIEAMWEGDGQWYPAVVIALSTSTVTVRFEDGIVQETNSQGIRWLSSHRLWDVLRHRLLEKNDETAVVSELAPARLDRSVYASTSDLQPRVSDALRNGGRQHPPNGPTSTSDQ